LVVSGSQTGERSDRQEQTRCWFQIVFHAVQCSTEVLIFPVTIFTNLSRCELFTSPIRQSAVKYDLTNFREV
jgi:hypothetical protein